MTTPDGDLFEAPQLLGGPPFDYDTYYNGIQQAKTLLIEAVNTFWEKQVRADPNYWNQIKRAALILFYEENIGGNPYDIVCQNEPARYQKGYAVLQNELVPAWTLYTKRASELLEVLKKAPK